MIVYFSATGNCRHTAKRIAAALSDRAVSIEEGRYEFELADGEVFGIVTPVYWWQLPIITREYLEKLTLKNAGYTFLVVTYGTMPGCCGEDAGRILEKRGITLDAAFSVCSPDSFTPIFDLSDPKKVEGELMISDAQTDGVIMSVRERVSGNRTHFRTPYAVRKVMDPLYNFIRTTDHFGVSENCIGCGICAKNCPTKAITMSQGRPVWTKTKCAICLRCLHNCPKFAITFKPGFAKTHGQYTNPDR